MASHYSEIYDPQENESHREAKWVEDEDSEEEGDGMWVYYEGYGQSSSEKDYFLVSINSDHPFWSSDDYDQNKKNEVYSGRTSGQSEKSVSFSDTCVAMMDGEWWPRSEKIDPEDRENRVSRNFSDMMCDYAEKNGPNEKKRFFKEGGRGMKWVENKELMGKIRVRIEDVNDLMEDPNFQLSLSDASVKNYPRYIFESFYQKYSEWINRKHESNLNVDAKVFIPGEQWMPILSRNSREMICGVYAIDPIPPSSRPEKKRPKSKVNSQSQMLWEMKNESDEKLKVIEKKLEVLIGMNGPVVTAEVI